MAKRVQGGSSLMMWGRIVYEEVGMMRFTGVNGIGYVTKPASAVGSTKRKQEIGRVRGENEINHDKAEYL
jgi:hypothetical protein